MARAFPRLQKFSVTENKPPTGSVPAGMTPDGKQLYRLTRERSRPRPKFIEDPITGVKRREFAKNPMTGEPLYGKNEPEFYTETILFFLEDQGNGNVSIVPYTPPTQEQLDKVARDHKVKRIQGELAEKLVARNIDIDALLDALSKAPAAGPVAPVAAVAAAGTPPAPLTIPEPKALGSGWYQLSNGDKVRCKTADDALEHEKRLQEAKIISGASPSF